MEDEEGLKLVGGEELNPYNVSQEQRVTGDIKVLLNEAFSTSLLPCLTAFALEDPPPRHPIFWIAQRLLKKSGVCKDIVLIDGTHISINSAASEDSHGEIIDEKSTPSVENGIVALQAHVRGGIVRKTFMTSKDQEDLQKYSIKKNELPRELTVLPFRRRNFEMKALLRRLAKEFCPGYEYYPLKDVLKRESSRQTLRIVSQRSGNVGGDTKSGDTDGATEIEEIEILPADFFKKALCERGMRIAFAHKSQKDSTTHLLTILNPGIFYGHEDTEAAKTVVRACAKNCKMAFVMVGDYFKESDRKKRPRTDATDLIHILLDEFEVMTYRELRNGNLADKKPQAIFAAENQCEQYEVDAMVAELCHRFKTPPEGLVGEAKTIEMKMLGEDMTRDRGERLIRTVGAKLCDYIDNSGDVSEKVLKLASPKELKDIFEASGVPLEISKNQEPVSDAALLVAIDSLLKYSVRTAHPLFLNQLYSRADPVGIAADWVSVATNTNCHTYEVAPVYTMMENEMLKKVASVVGGAFAQHHDGLFVPGGSISNLYGLHVARNKSDPGFKTRGANGGPRLVAFTSDQSHYSYLKSARLTGLGSDNLISVETDDATGQMKAEALEEAVSVALKKGQTPFFVGSTAGTTVIGAYDPFEDIGRICKKHGMWHHVDSCWGGGAMFSSKYRKWVSGLGDAADSISWNPHKMSGAPLQCSIFLTSHANVLKETNGTNAAYLFQPDKLHADLDTGDKTIQCGRKTDMFKLWLLWKHRGDRGMGASVERCFDLARFTADFMKRETSGAWELAYEPSCANVCFWYVPKALRPFKWTPASTPSKGDEEQETRERLVAEIHKVAPLMKTRMQREGDAMIGFQSVNGRPNFFRLVFPSGESTSESDVLGMLRRMEVIGESVYPGEDK
eukprot:g3539.t1